MAGMFIWQQIQRGSTFNTTNRPLSVHTRRNARRLLSSYSRSRSQDHITMTDYTQLKVPDLKKLLSERGLAVSGNKADLIARLQEHDKKPAGTFLSFLAPNLESHRTDGQPQLARTRLIGTRTTTKLPQLQRLQPLLQEAKVRLRIRLQYQTKKPISTLQQLRTSKLVEHRRLGELLRRLGELLRRLPQQQQRRLLRQKRRSRISPSVSSRRTRTRRQQSERHAPNDLVYPRTMRQRSWLSVQRSLDWMQRTRL